MVYISILSSRLICILPFAAGDVTDLGGLVETGAAAKAVARRQTHLHKRTDTQTSTQAHAGTRKQTIPSFES